MSDDEPRIKVPSGDDPKLTLAVRRGVKLVADELGAKFFADGTAVFVVALDGRGHASIAIAGNYSLEMAEQLVRAAEGVRNKRAV
jgi:hypothetical protein